LKPQAELVEARRALRRGAVALSPAAAENQVVRGIVITVLALGMAGGPLFALGGGTAREPAGVAATVHAVPAPEARVDINHASTAELMKVPGMTQSWAGRIVRFRPYRAKTDLLENGVLPSDVYDRIKDYIIAHREKK
jgi:DNA uptake protein ComE-like DNA-binding protein